MTEKDITNIRLMKENYISANIIKTGKNIALDKVENIYEVINVTRNDVLEFIQPEDEENV